MCCYRSWCHFILNQGLIYQSLVCCKILCECRCLVWSRCLSFYLCDCCFAVMTMVSAPSTGPAGRAAPTWWTCSSWEGRASTSWTEETIRLCTWPPATDTETLWERLALVLFSFDSNCKNRTSSSQTSFFSLFSPVSSLMWCNYEEETGHCIFLLVAVWYIVHVQLFCIKHAVLETESEPRCRVFAS